MPAFIYVFAVFSESSSGAIQPFEGEALFISRIVPGCGKKGTTGRVRFSGILCPKENPFAFMSERRLSHISVSISIVKYHPGRCGVSPQKG